MIRVENSVILPLFLWKNVFTLHLPLFPTPLPGIWRSFHLVHVASPNISERELQKRSLSFFLCLYLSYKTWDLSLDTFPAIQTWKMCKTKMQKRNRNGRAETERAVDSQTGAYTGRVRRDWRKSLWPLQIGRWQA